MPKGRQHYLLVVGLGIALVPALALGQSVRAPAPFVDPQATTTRNLDTLTLTSAIPLPHDPMPAKPSQVRDVTTLKAGLDALSAADIAGARKYRDSLPDDALDRHILTWAIAMSGRRDVSSDEIAQAMRVLSQWPGGEALKANSERALYRESPDPLQS